MKPYQDLIFVSNLAIDNRRENPNSSRLVSKKRPICQGLDYLYSTICI